MDVKTLEALKGSIEKWERIVAGTGVDQGVANCPLCKLFHNKNCRGCPIYEKVKISGCDGTPYEDWIFHYESKHGEKEDVKVYCPTCKELAQRELDLLKSLLPKER